MGKIGQGMELGLFTLINYEDKSICKGWISIVFQKLIFITKTKNIGSKFTNYAKSKYKFIDIFKRNIPKELF